MRLCSCILQFRELPRGFNLGLVQTAILEALNCFRNFGFLPSRSHRSGRIKAGAGAEGKQRHKSEGITE